MPLDTSLPPLDRSSRSHTTRTEGHQRSGSRIREGQSRPHVNPTGDRAPRVQSRGPVPGRSASKIRRHEQDSKASSSRPQATEDVSVPRPGDEFADRLKYDDELFQSFEIERLGQAANRAGIPVTVPSRQVTREHVVKLISTLPTSTYFPTSTTLHLRGGALRGSSDNPILFSDNKSLTFGRGLSDEAQQDAEGVIEALLYSLPADSRIRVNRERDRSLHGSTRVNGHQATIGIYCGSRQTRAGFIVSLAHEVYLHAAFDINNPNPGSEADDHRKILTPGDMYQNEFYLAIRQVVAAFPELENEIMEHYADNISEHAPDGTDAEQADAERLLDDINLVHDL